MTSYIFSEVCSMVNLPNCVICFVPPYELIQFIQIGTWKLQFRLHLGNFVWHDLTANHWDHTIHQTRPNSTQLFNSTVNTADCIEDVIKSEFCLWNIKYCTISQRKSWLSLFFWILVRSFPYPGHFRRATQLRWEPTYMVSSMGAHALKTDASAEVFPHGQIGGYYFMKYMYIYIFFHNINWTWDIGQNEIVPAKISSYISQFPQELEASRTVFVTRAVPGCLLHTHCPVPPNRHVSLANGLRPRLWSGCFQWVSTN